MENNKQQLYAIINDVVSLKHDKYERYDDLLDAKFYHDLISYLRSLDTDKIEMNENIYYGYIAESVIFDKLLEYAKNNDDLALEIINKKRQIAGLILRKMGMSKEVDVDSILYDAIISYDLSGDFDKYLVSYIRNTKENKITKKF